MLSCCLKTLEHCKRFIHTNFAVRVMFKTEKFERFFSRRELTTGIPRLPSDPSTSPRRLRSRTN